MKIFCHRYSSSSFATHTISANSYTSDFIGFLPTTPRNLWVDKLSKGKLVYRKWYASQIHICLTYTERISCPILINTLFPANVIKLIYYPCVLQWHSVITFSQPSTSYSIHTFELPTWGSSISLHYAFPRNIPSSPCSDEATRPYERVFYTQHHSSYLQGLVIDYGPTT